MSEKLDLSKFIGRRQVVVPRYVKQIEETLETISDPSVKQMMTAYLDAFKAYEEISNMDGEYIKKTLEYLTKEYLYLKQKFPNVDIKPEGRIKSPLSADVKIRNKIKEYSFKNRDFSRITESLRDFIGYRYVISVKGNPKEQVNVCYQVLQAQMEFQYENGFEFIPIGEEKQRKIKTKQKYKNSPEKKDVYIPKMRPESIEEFDPFFKDYIMFPTETLYQSAQYCVIPPWAKDMKNGHPIAMEYQVRTEKMHLFAENDLDAAHDSYKKISNVFHRLRVPFQFTNMLDKDGNEVIGQIPYDISIKKIYGTSFYDRFGIDYNDFIALFDESTQDQIYAGNYHVELVDGEYQVVKAPRKEKPITLIKKAVETTKKQLSNPSKLFRDLFSYKIEDEDIDLTF